MRYEALCHLSICFSIGKGSPLSSYIVEERPVVHIGIRGRIVTIERTRASFGTIVRIAESSEGTKTQDKEFYLSFDKDGAKVVNFRQTTMSKSDFYIKNLALTGKVGAIAPCVPCFALPAQDTKNAVVSQSSSASQRNAP